MATAAEVVLKVMGEVRGLAKKDKNTNQNFNFRGIDSVMNVVGPALRDAGGFVVPKVLSSQHGQVANKSGGMNNTCHLEVEFSVYGTEGDPVVGVVAAESFDAGDKATAKAMSVAMRTFLLQLLCLPTDEPDPDSYSYETAKPVSVDKTPHIDDAEWLKRAEDYAWKEDREGLLRLYSVVSQVPGHDELLTKIKALGESVAKQKNSAK